MTRILVDMSATLFHHGHVRPGRRSVHHRKPGGARADGPFAEPELTDDHSLADLLGHAVGNPRHVPVGADDGDVRHRLRPVRKPERHRDCIVRQWPVDAGQGITSAHVDIPYWKLI